VNEEQWLACSDPKGMLAFRQGWSRSRKRLLYGCACCRLAWAWLSEEPRRALEVCEQAADGSADEGVLSDALGLAQQAREQGWRELRRLAEELGESRRRGREDEALARRYADADVASTAAAAPECLLRRLLAGRRLFQSDSVARAASLSAHALRLAVRDSREARRRETWRLWSHQAGLLRDLFGNPFRRPAFKRRWRTPDVASLTLAAYEERLLPSGELDPLRLAVLADALEEAGASGEMAGHLRSAGPHVRGCWALDLILGKQ
jgi:hypothetical protein